MVKYDQCNLRALPGMTLVFRIKLNQADSTLLIPCCSLCLKELDIIDRHILYPVRAGFSDHCVRGWMSSRSGDLGRCARCKGCSDV